MHDTSTQSMSRWKAVGAKRNDSSILGPSTPLQSKRESRKYRPSKQKELPNSRIFNRNRSRIDSLDNIPKQDLNDSNLNEVPSQKIRRPTKNSQQITAPIVRVNSETTLLKNKDFTAIEAIKQRRTSSFGAEKELIILKEDFNRFKQKILNQLQTQKLNIQNFVNEVLQTVRQQLLAIEERYAKTSNLRRDQSIPEITQINIANLNGIETKFRVGDISTISHIRQENIERTSSEKLLINELTCLKGGQDDPITQRFSKFYSAIQKLKSELDCLHQISAVNKQDTQADVNPSKFTSTIQNRQFSPFLKT